MIIWSYLSIGWYVIGITTFVMCFALYLSVKKQKKTPIILGLIVYLLFIEIYFFYFRINLPDPGPFTTNTVELNWGTAFMALIIVALTPFFIAMNLLDLSANIFRSKK